MPVNPFEPPCMMGVRGGVWFDLLEPLGIKEVRGGTSVDLFEPPGMLRVTEGCLIHSSHQAC